MDPVTALGVAAAAVQFLQFSLQALETCRQIREDAECSTQQNKDLERAVRTAKDARRELEASQTVKVPRRIADITRECIRDSDELIRVLEHVRGDGQAIGAWKATLRTMRERKTIEKLKNSLSDKQQTLDRLLVQGIWTWTELTAIEHRDDFKKLDQNVQNLVQKLLSLTEDVANFERSSQARFDHVETKITENFKRAAIQADARQKETERKVERRQMEAEIQKQHERFLNSLFFEDIHHRRAIIKDAAPGTLDWMFNIDSRKRDPSRRVQWDDFAAWLRDNDATCYWISGKLGSGKSTLMAHLVDSTQTSKELEQWSLNSELRILSFYFWQPGSVLQKSILGLLRSLLYQICRDQPAIISVLLSHLKTTIDRLSTWTEKSLRSTITKAILTVQHIKFCLFIDGLDEYVADEGYNDLTDLVFDLASLPNVKCCVSSRPEVQLSRSFEACKKLRLEDLNHKDIEDYVRQQLQTAELHENEKLMLANSITCRAEGVFLWAALVTRDLLNAIISGDDIQTLYERIETVPKTMHDLFRAMLAKVDDFHQKSLAFYVKVITMPALYDLRKITCLAAAEMDTGIDSLDEFYSLCRRLETRINSRSAGLLQVRNPYVVDEDSSISETEVSSQRERPEKYTAYIAGEWKYYRRNPYIAQLIRYEYTDINFVHRSARDFIHSPDGRQMLGEELPRGKDVLIKLWTGAYRYLGVAPSVVDPEYEPQILDGSAHCGRNLGTLMSCMGKTLEDERDIHLQGLASDILDDIRKRPMIGLFPGFLDEDDSTKTLTRGTPPRYTKMELFWSIFALCECHFYMQSNIDNIRNHPNWQAAMGIMSLFGKTRGIQFLRAKVFVGDLAQRLRSAEQKMQRCRRTSIILHSFDVDIGTCSTISFEYPQCDGPENGSFEIIADWALCAAFVWEACPTYGHGMYHENKERALAWKSISEASGIAEISQSLYMGFGLSVDHLALQISAVDLPLFMCGRVDMVVQRKTRVICFPLGRRDIDDKEWRDCYGYPVYLPKAIILELDPSTSRRIFRLMSGRVLANRLETQLQNSGGQCPEWFLSEIDEWVNEETGHCRALLTERICINVQGLDQTDQMLALACVMLHFEQAVRDHPSYFVNNSKPSSEWVIPQMQEL